MCEVLLACFWHVCFLDSDRREDDDYGSKNGVQCERTLLLAS
jgi:hypothetical protein